MSGALLLSCDQISKAYGSAPLFEGLSFGLFEGAAGRGFEIHDRLRPLGHSTAIAAAELRDIGPRERHRRRRTEFHAATQRAATYIRALAGWLRHAHQAARDRDERGRVDLQNQKTTSTAARFARPRKAVPDRS